MKVLKWVEMFIDCEIPYDKGKALGYLDASWSVDGAGRKALHYCKAGCDEFILGGSYQKVTQVLRLLFQKSRKLKDEYRLGFCGAAGFD
jgi:hypothetical protein